MEAAVAHLLAENFQQQQLNIFTPGLLVQRLAQQLFSGLRHDRLLLEFDTVRAGGFEPLRFVPKGKTVVLGLVSTKRAELESKDEMQRRGIAPVDDGDALALTFARPVAPAQHRKAYNPPGGGSQYDWMA